MKCRQCGHESPYDFRFCPECGVQAGALPTAQQAQAGDESAAAVGRGIAQVGDGHVALSGDVQGDVIFAEQGATVIIGEAPVVMTAVERESALGRYLQHMVSRNRYLQLQGIRSGGRLVHIELDQIYVTLRASRQRVVTAEEEWLAHEAGLAPGELQRQRERPATTTETVTVRVDEALAAHDRLVVLGDPGSGKTTLLRYLALLYARDLAEDSTLVSAKLGLEESGRLPILLPLRQIGAYLRAHHPTDDGTEGCALLLDFVLGALKGERISLPDDFFDDWLVTGRAAVLLDGLDEVADPDLRRRVSRLVEAFTRAYPACRYVVTSRIVGYQGPARLGEAYAVTTVRDFSLADVERFLANWHRLVAVGQMGPGTSAEAYAAEQTRLLLAAIEANERIRELAINPLMLTVIAMVHRDRVKLPDRRAELYAEAVDVLLGKWEEAKGVQETPILEDQPFDTGDRRLMLQGLALHLHEGQQKEIAAGDLRRWLGEQFQPILGGWRAVERAVDRFLCVIQERTGLLVARGEGVYAFSHLTFQEYLAALAVAARDDYVEYTLRRAPDPWWREVILLEAGFLSLQSKERTTRLVQAIADAKTEPEPYHNLVLAAECLRHVGVARVEAELSIDVQKRIRQDIERGWLYQVAMLAGRLKDAPSLRWPYDLIKPYLSEKSREKIHQMTIIGRTRRSAAARALAEIGFAYWSMPYGEPEWVLIPGGGFWMGVHKDEIPTLVTHIGGEPDSYYRETPQHQVILPTYSIAKVPVTNAQYRLFVEATGQASPQHWEEGRPSKGSENHPVVFVSWHDAMAYCRWLSEMTGKYVTLPSEAEWEKAARGAKDKRAYPWGNSFESTYLNSWKLGLGGTTPVGIFPHGASPHDVLDMAGNVWEWTRSVYKEYPYNPADGREELRCDDNEHRVMRGGAFNSSAKYVRCAYRATGDLDDRNRNLGFRVCVAVRQD